VTRYRLLVAIHKLLVRTARVGNASRRLRLELAIPNVLRGAADWENAERTDELFIIKRLVLH
jgi:hypothetical protein